MRYGKQIGLSIIMGLSCVACTYIPPGDEEPPELPAQSADPLHCENMGTCTVAVPESHEILKRGPNPNGDTYDDVDDSAPAKVPVGLQKGSGNY
ncbi:MAG: hypothetical protein QM752_04970 [Gammaproteobacteria bacterium]